MNKLIKTYIGFCIKSRAIVIGQDRLKSNKDKIHLILYCSSASQNLIDLGKRLSERFGCEYLKVDGLAEYTNLDGCKIVGLTNQSLADAIIKVLNEGVGENNGK